MFFFSVLNLWKQYGKISSAALSRIRLNLGSVPVRDHWLLTRHNALLIKHWKVLVASTGRSTVRVFFPCNNRSNVTFDDYDRIFTINSRAPLFLCQAAVSVFQKQKSCGSIVNIGSINACCGQTDTEHRVQLAEGRRQDWVENIPQTFAPTGSILCPEQITPHALFWLSDQSWPVNGQGYEVEQYRLIGRSRINDG